MKHQNPLKTPSNTNKNPKASDKKIGTRRLEKAKLIITVVILRARDRRRRLSPYNWSWS